MAVVDVYVDTYSNYYGVDARFEVPTISEPMSNDLLGRYFKRRVGQTLTLTGGEWVLSQYPTQDEINAADVVYRGGFVHGITTEEWAALVGGGFEDSLYYALLD